jgi:hypothetical protein
MAGQATAAAIVLLSIDLGPDAELSIHLSAWMWLAISVLIAACFAWLWFGKNLGIKNFELDETEVGIGTSKLKFKPNLTDRQVAYSIWVELSTRKIGLPIDLDHDVVAEIYDSWYSFFSVTRDLVKTIPVKHVRHDSTQKIIRLSIEVLNEGLRPHLTKWQARFRRWYEHEIDKKPEGAVIDPQEIQKKFPKWNELKNDIEQVNKHLIRYRHKMHDLVLGN